MERNTIIAVVLSVIVISVGFIIQNQFVPEESYTEQAVEVDNSVVETTNVSVELNTTRSNDSVSVVEEEGLVESDYSLQTDLFSVRFSNRGGVVTSLVLNEHMDQNVPVEMVYENEYDYNFFEIHFGNPDTEPVDDLFHFRKIDNNTVEFYRSFTGINEEGESIPFILTKTYEFIPDEYLFTLEISIENSINDYISLDNEGISYTLGIGSQIGPTYTKLDGRYSYRKFYSYAGNKLETRKVKDGFESTSDPLMWSAISGKYFSVVGIPASNFSTSWSSLSNIEGEEHAFLYYSRPLIQSSANVDTFRFYVGPRNNDLNIYNNAEDNALGLSGLELDEVIDSGGILAWLEVFLRFMLELFYKLIPNYGVAIILLTIFIKVVLFPLTHKSYESSGKMQKLQPQIKEIQAKYENDKEKMNQKMAELYKKSGVNPMGGCLPMLIQMPILIAFYGLLNKYFDLRGASFLAPWIMDLSGPESIFQLPFTIPILGWSDIRLLPFIMLGTQLLSSQISQSANQTGSNSQMKMMTTFMPIIFFFILYNMPSGLLLYWTISNAITVGQQKITTYIISKKEDK